MPGGFEDITRLDNIRGVSPCLSSVTAYCTTSLGSLEIGRRLGGYGPGSISGSQLFAV